MGFFRYYRDLTQDGGDIPILFGKDETRVVTSNTVDFVWQGCV